MKTTATNMNKAYFCGQPSDQGQIESTPFLDSEGYAVITCGNTTFKIGYTALHKFLLGDDYDTASQSVRRGLSSICAEASVGRTPAK